MSRHPCTGRTGSRVLLFVLLAAMAAGCQWEGLQFKNDHRLSFVSPRPRERVEVPLTISWSMRDFVAVGLDGSSDPGRGVFAVFVDRPPMPAGKGLDWLARGDAGCERVPGCPDASYLADRGVYLTTELFVTLESLPPTDRARGDEQHYVNVVLLDGSGDRIGESGWHLPFAVERRHS